MEGLKLQSTVYVVFSRLCKWFKVVVYCVCCLKLQSAVCVCGLRLQSTVSVCGLKLKSTVCVV